MPSLEPWALKNQASMELPQGMGEKNQHGKVKALRLISSVVIATFEPVVFGSCVWMKGTLSVPWRSQRLELCAALWEAPVNFPLHGFLREREVGWLLVWEYWFLNGSYFSLLHLPEWELKLLRH